MTAPRPPPPVPSDPDGLERVLARARSAFPPPAPPPFPDVMARIDADRAQALPVRLLRSISDLRAPARWAGAAAALLLLGVVAAWWVRPDVSSTPLGSGGDLVLVVPPSVRVLREGRPLARDGASVHARAGDEVVADGKAKLRLGDRSTIELEPHARMRLGGSDAIDVGDPVHAVELLDGRATFQVRHDDVRAFLVATASVQVIDRGTRFAVEVSAEPAGERVLVTVEEGEVAVEQTGGFTDVLTGRFETPPWTLLAGQGLAFVAGSPTGAPFSLDARPRLSLEAEDVSPSHDRPVVVRLAFSNPTDGWIALPAYDPVRAPLHVQIQGPDGSIQAVRVSESMLVDGGGSGRSLPPRGTVVLRVRFERTFASPGTYRLRAIYRPAGAVDEGASPDLVLPVR